MSVVSRTEATMPSAFRACEESAGNRLHNTLPGSEKSSQKVAAAAERNTAGGGGSDVADAVAAAAEMNQGKMTR
jgi:hypothetical protein